MKTNILFFVPFIFKINTAIRPCLEKQETMATSFGVIDNIANKVTLQFVHDILHVYSLL